MEWYIYTQLNYKKGGENFKSIKVENSKHKVEGLISLSAIVHEL